MLWQRGKAYSQDLRDRVFAAADAGTPVGQIADMLLVSGSYVSKVLIRRCQTGETTARPQCCHVPAKLSDYHAAIREQVAARPDATLAELRTWLVQTHQVSVNVTLMWETLAQLRLTLKKRLCTRQNRTARMSPRHVACGAKASLR
jgi:transposase